MESKAGLLSDAYKRINALYDKVEENSKSINSIEQEIAREEKDSSAFNPQNASAIEAQFDQIVYDKIEEEKENAMIAATKQQEYIASEYSRLLLRNYMCCKGWFINKTNPDRIIYSCIPQIYSSEEEIRPKKGSIVVDREGKFSTLFTILFWLFLWPMILTYKVVKFICDIFFDGGFTNGLLALMVAILAGVAWFDGIEKLFRSVPVLSTLVRLAIVLFVIFIIVQIVVSHRIIRSDADKFYAVMSPDGYVDACLDVLNQSIERKREKWHIEREGIRTGGRGELIDAIRNDYATRYALSYSLIEQKKERLLSIREEQQKDESDYANARAEAKQLQEQLKQPVTDPKYNSGLLSERVAVNISGEWMTVIWHGADLCVFVYDGDAYNTQEDVRRMIARFIGEMYYGLVYENYYNIIDFRVMDYETGGALLSLDDKCRELWQNEVIRVVKNSREGDELYYELEKKRERIIGIAGTGSINTYNPRCLESGDDPLPYQVVIHYGKETRSIERGRMQLYKSAGLIGFVPMFVMSKTEYDNVSKDNYTETKELFIDRTCIEL